MKINFNKTQDGHHQAMILRKALEECNKNNTSSDTLMLIEDLLQQIDDFVAMYEKGHNDTSFSDFFSSLWNFLSGPSQKELELSKQRKELVERAEHAENAAFQALAESSDLKHQIEEAQQKIRELEQELGKNRG